MNVYVDGFNLYHGVGEHLRHLAWSGQPEPDHWKWIDLRALGQRLVPQDQVHRVRYFTARVTAPKHDPQMEQRQQAYLRALDTLPNLTTHFGQFKVQKKRMPLVNTPGFLRTRLWRVSGLGIKQHPDGNRTVRVLRTEEKGSDVNLATYLLLDAFDKDCEKALVISNDTDLCEPIDIVVDRFKLPVIAVNPRGHRKTAADLRKVATQTRRLRLAAVTGSQLPVALADAKGTITRPARW